MSLPRFAYERKNVAGWVPPLSREDVNLADKVAKEHLGEQASAGSLGAYARGVVGDAAFYGEAILITDPEVFTNSNNWGEYLEKLDEVARTVGNTIANAGNVVVEITHLTDKK